MFHLSVALLFLADPAGTQLAKSGRVLAPVVVSSNASAETKRAASDLAAMLERITRAPFRVEVGDGSRGIAVGVSGELSGAPRLDLKDRFEREDYLLRSHVRGLFVIAASARGIEHAVWDLLYRIGYRQFFPGETWEVVPAIDVLSIAVDAHEHPSYHSRRIWFGHGAWGYNAAPFTDWQRKNRLGGGVLLSSGHAYAKIVKRNAAVFAEHPEYLGLVDGKRTSNKLCISNPALRELVIKDALAHAGDADSIALDPSDGGGWCECDRCAKLGTISDRAVTLSNAVAEKSGDKLVGMYAYNLHAPPPKIRVHRNVAVNVATAFIPGGLRVEELLGGWSKQGAQVGIREYFSVNAWDRDAPGRARAANLDYIATSIPKFHALGARFFSAESGDNWGPNGLGYYLASRVLWDVREGARKRELVEDFLLRAFGDARAPIAEFYRAIDGASSPLLSDDLVGRMYRQLEAAKKKTRDAVILRRIDALILYTRYVELFHDYSSARGEARQPAFEALMAHSYRMRTTSMVHAKALHRTLPKRDKAVVMPKQLEERAFAAAEVAGFIEGGKKRVIAEFEPIAFSPELVALTDPQGKVTTSTLPITTRGDVTLAVVVTDAAQPIELSVASGFFGPKRSYKDAELELFASTGATLEKQTIPQDSAFHAVTFKVKSPGTYTLEIRERKRGAKITWPPAARIAIQAPAAIHGRWTASFYVPPKTKLVGGFAAGAGVVRDSTGAIIHTFTAKPGYFAIPVPAGQDNKLWSFDKSAGERSLLTVPPYLFRSPAEAIVPTATR